MYLIVFSCFTKSSVINNDINSSWCSIYRHVIQIKLVGGSKMKETALTIISKDKEECRGGEIPIKYSFPIAIKAFKSKEEINLYKRLIPVINHRLRNMETSNKKHNITRAVSNSVNYPIISCIRHIKVKKEEDNNFVQTMELNGFTLEVCSIINKVLDIGFQKKDKKVDLEEYKRLRIADKCLSKNSIFTMNNNKY